jgi:peptidoglycan/LPS O-acetylase OafA/YrhL
MTGSVRLVRCYGLLIGAGLLLEGGALLLLEVLRVAPGNTRHNALHVVWGLAIGALLAISRGQRWTLLVVGGFGVFYTGLAVVGVLVDQPLGLRLGPGENAFHFTVGPLALLLTLRAAVQLSSSSNRSADSVSSAAPNSTTGA